MKFPNDADGDALRRIYEDGINFNEPQNVDFFIAVPNEKSGEEILTILKDEGFNCELGKRQTAYTYKS